MMREDTQNTPASTPLLLHHPTTTTTKTQGGSRVRHVIAAVALVVGCAALAILTRRGAPSAPELAKRASVDREDATHRAAAAEEEGEFYAYAYAPPVEEAEPGVIDIALPGGGELRIYSTQTTSTRTSAATLVLRAPDGTPTATGTATASDTSSTSDKTQTLDLRSLDGTTSVTATASATSSTLSTTTTSTTTRYLPDGTKVVRTTTATDDTTWSSE